MLFFESEENERRSMGRGSGAGDGQLGDSVLKTWLGDRNGCGSGDGHCLGRYRGNGHGDGRCGFGGGDGRSTIVEFKKYVDDGVWLEVSS